MVTKYCGCDNDFYAYHVSRVIKLGYPAFGPLGIIAQFLYSYVNFHTTKAYVKHDFLSDATTDAFLYTNVPKLLGADAPAQGTSMLEHAQNFITPKLIESPVVESSPPDCVLRACAGEYTPPAGTAANSGAGFPATIKQDSKPSVHVVEDTGDHVSGADVVPADKTKATWGFEDMMSSVVDKFMHTLQSAVPTINSEDLTEWAPIIYNVFINAPHKEVNCTLKDLCPSFIRDSDTLRIANTYGHYVRSHIHKNQASLPPRLVSSCHVVYMLIAAKYKERSSKPKPTSVSTSSHKAKY